MHSNIYHHNFVLSFIHLAEATPFSSFTCETFNLSHIYQFIDASDRLASIIISTQPFITTHRYVDHLVQHTLIK